MGSEEAVLTSDRFARLESLYEASSPRVLAYALRRTVRHDAEEVVADTFTIAWRRLDDIPDDPIPWLLAVARRILANQRRATARRIALEQRLGQASGTGTHLAADPAEEVAARMALEDALLRLSESDREALLLVAWDGLDNRSAAAVMDCSPRIFAVRLHRARRRLVQRLDQIDADRKQRSQHTFDVACPEEA